MEYWSLSKNLGGSRVGLPASGLEPPALIISLSVPTVDRQLNRGSLSDGLTVNLSAKQLYWRPSDILIKCNQ